MALSLWIYLEMIMKISETREYIIAQFKVLITVSKA